MSNDYAFCPGCDELVNVVVEAECKTCTEEIHFDLRCNCGRRFYATPNQVAQVAAFREHLFGAEIPNQENKNDSNNH